MHDADDLVVCLYDLNDHLGRNIDGLHCVYGGYGIGH